MGLPSASHPGRVSTAGIPLWWVCLPTANQGAIHVDHVLKGATPGDLPVQGPTKYSFVINVKTAKALGIEVPLNLLIFTSGTANAICCRADRGANRDGPRRGCDFLLPLGAIDFGAIDGRRTISQ